MTRFIVAAILPINGLARERCVTLATGEGLLMRV
jgi:hypothetical protein